MVDLLGEDRRRRIVDRVQRDGNVRVVDLAIAFAVTEETVRRDLKLLDRQGVLTRTHGGAIQLSQFESPARSIEKSFDQRRQQMLMQKKAIAAEAFKRITGPLTIALDGSTTAWELAAHLTDPQLTVVTNSLMIITLLAGREHPQVISVGGTLDRKLMMFTGMIAREGLRHLHVDLFFCSCGGIDPARGFADPSESSAQFKRQLMQAADKTILLADSTKFTLRAPVVFAAVDEIDELITDSDAPDNAVQQIMERGLPVTLIT